MAKFWNKRIANEQTTMVRCLNCRREYDFGVGEGRFHGLSDLVAGWENGRLVIPGLHSGGHALLYCEECHKTMSLEQKKALVWRICCQSFDEASAVEALARARHLCAQIDEGL